jgi:hypothetical protein
MQAPAAPPVLNDRQRQYLLAAYQTDQQAEQERKRDYLRGTTDRRPASEWRWLPYGCWEHWPGRPPTPLREQLASRDAKLISEGTGSTWRALAQRGLLEVEDQLPYIIAGLPPAMHYQLPHIRLTPAGRKLARQLTGEVRAPKPTKVLARATWQLLAQLWHRHPNATHQVPAYASGEVFSRLERSAPAQKVLGQANQERLVEGWPTYGLTTVGRIYYHQYFKANTAAHPDVAASDPGPLPAELLITLEQLDEQARRLVHAPPTNLFEQWQQALRTGFSAFPLYLEPYQRQDWVRRGLPEAPPVAGEQEPGKWGSNLYASWRLYVRDWHLRHQLAPADWNRYCLWQAVELVAGKLEWQRNRLDVRAFYSEKSGVVRGSLGRYTSNYQVRELGTLMLQLALQHRCSRWLVNLRHVENINVPLLRRGLVDGFIRAGLQLASAAPLRVAVVAPPIPLAAWRASLPTTLNWEAFEWHELLNEPAAEAWLTQP